jgi:hypothetical protein
MNPQSVALLKLDLIMTGSYTIQTIESPYSPTEEWLEAMNKAYSATRRASQRRQRINTLVYAYYMGKLIQSSVTPKEKWREFIQRKSIPNEQFVYKGTTRVYQLFATDIDQIYRTQHTTLRKIGKLNNQQYNELINFKGSNEEDFEI